MPSKTARFETRLTEDERLRLDRAAEAAGLTPTAYWKRFGLPPLDGIGGIGRFPFAWCPDDFIAFCVGEADTIRFATERDGTAPARDVLAYIDEAEAQIWKGLELPDGGEFVLEAHLRLIIAHVFAAGEGDPGKAAWRAPYHGLVSLLTLLPKGNYKTTLFAALAVFHVLTVRNANCYIGAADKEQAREMYRFASHFAACDPRIERRLVVRQSMWLIRSEVDQSFIRVLASDDSQQGGKKQGFNPTLALVDELHAHENNNLYADMRSGLFKAGGLMVIISTAGHDEESVLGLLRSGFLEMEDKRVGLAHDGTERDDDLGRLTICRAPSGRTVMLEWACTDDDDLSDSEVVMLANPAKGVTLESIDDAREDPGITSAQFARYRANVWAQADDAEIEAGVWDALNDGSKIPDGEPRWVIIDYARKSDASACTELWLDPERQVVVPRTHVWALELKGAGRVQPAAHELIKGERTIRQSRIREHVYTIAEDAPIHGVVYDPHLFDPEELEARGFTMIEFPQTVPRLVPASKALYEAINEGRVKHDGDPVLRSHVTAAASIPAGEGWRFSKAKSKKRIDALMTLVFGIEDAFTEMGGGFEW